MVLLESVMKLKTGDRAPHFKLKCIDGKFYSLDDFSKKALLIIFICNHCPYVQAKIETIKKLANDFPDASIVGINSNDDINYPDDSFENMKKFAKEKKFNFIYLHDPTQDVARAYGASCTPDPFLFGSKRRLIYHGRLNNAMEPGDKAAKHDMTDNIRKLLAGEKIEKSFVPSIGCSIKWKN